MKTVTKTYKVCTASELMDICPLSYNEELEKWRYRQVSYDWWEDTLRHVADEPQYYTPEYRGAQPADKEKAAERWAGVVGFTSYGVARKFDIDFDTIELQDFELCIHDFLKLMNYEYPEPFVLDAILREFPRGRRIVEIGEEFGSSFFMDGMDIASNFLVEVFGTPTTKEDGGFTDDAVLLASNIEDCLEQIKELIRDFIDDMGQAILSVLKDEFEWLTSEEAFLNSDLEFEVLDNLAEE